MPPFPYLDIFKKAYFLSIRNPWLWAFGFFIGGVGGINFGSFNFVFSPPRDREFQSLEQMGANVSQWISSNTLMFALIAAAVFALAIVLVIFSGISKGAVIWSARKFGEKEPVGFKPSLRSARKYMWRVIVLHSIVTLAYFVTLLVFVLPITYLFSVGAASRAVILSVIGFVIFIPASVVFSFMHLYGPIFVVLYDISLPAAVHHSFNLIRQKLKESILFALYLFGFAILFIFGLGFSIILAGVPLALFGWFMLSLGFGAGVNSLITGFIVLAVAYVIIMGSGFAVFQNIAWVLAVEEMIKTRKLPEKESKTVPAIEPVA